MSTRIAVTISADFIANLLRNGATAPATLVEGGIPADSKLDRVEYKLGSPTMRLVFKSENGSPIEGYDTEVVQDIKPVFVSTGNFRLNPTDVLTTGPSSSADPDARAAQEVAQLRAAGKLPPAPTPEEMMRRALAQQAQGKPVRTPPPTAKPNPLGVEEPKAAEFTAIPLTPEQEALLAEPGEVIPKTNFVPAPALTEAEQLATETGATVDEVKASNAPKNKGGRPPKKPDVV